MSTIVVTGSAVAAGPRLSTESMRAALLWLMAFSGGFVFIEPGPYEVIGMAALFLIALTGLTLRAALAPLVLLLVLLNIGYACSLFLVIDKTEAVIWVLVSVFLSLTAIFFAAVLGANTEARLKWLMRGYMAAAVIVSLIAIAGYFRMFGRYSDWFVIFSRAKGTFKDPNVFAAFLILPGLLLFQRILSGRRSQALGAAMLLLPLLGGLFLSFSRAAWGQYVFCALLLMLFMFLTSRSANARLRIVVVAIIGGVAAAAFVALLLSVDQVAALFEERASLSQSYDTGHTGRFGRYALAIQLSLDFPFGMGPLQFLFPEAPHNTYLNSFITGGWITGVAYLTLTLVTLIAGFRFAFVRTPWQPAYQVVYIAYVGVAAESAIIDSDHWRHYFLILGVLWGLMAVSHGYSATAQGRTAAGSPTV